MYLLQKRVATFRPLFWQSIACPAVFVSDQHIVTLAAEDLVAAYLYRDNLRAVRMRTSGHATEANIH